jgi:hypothetical protein
MIMHIRRPLRAARGNQFYRDKSDRGQGTYCGAAETAYDIPASERKPLGYEIDGRTVCAHCLKERAK